jgi:hypothetical protein
MLWTHTLREDIYPEGRQSFAAQYREFSKACLLLDISQFDMEKK